MEQSADMPAPSELSMASLFPIAQEISLTILNASPGPEPGPGFLDMPAELIDAVFDQDEDG
jgi:hypothetical protein